VPMPSPPSWLRQPQLLLPHGIWAEGLEKQNDLLVAPVLRAPSPLT
jgi:hypothetical protein